MAAACVTCVASACASHASRALPVYPALLARVWELLVSGALATALSATRAESLKGEAALDEALLRACWPLLFTLTSALSGPQQTAMAAKLVTAFVSGAWSSLLPPSSPATQLLAHIGSARVLAGEAKAEAPLALLQLLPGACAVWVALRPESVAELPGRAVLLAAFRKFLLADTGAEAPVPSAPGLSAARRPTALAAAFAAALPCLAALVNKLSRAELDEFVASPVADELLPLVLARGPAHTPAPSPGSRAKAAQLLPWLLQALLLRGHAFADTLLAALLELLGPSNAEQALAAVASTGFEVTSLAFLQGLLHLL